MSLQRRPRTLVAERENREKKGKLVLFADGGKSGGTRKIQNKSKKGQERKERRKENIKRKKELVVETIEHLQASRCPWPL